MSVPESRNVLGTLRTGVPGVPGSERPGTDHPGTGRTSHGRNTGPGPTEPARRPAGSAVDDDSDPTPKP